MRLIDADAFKRQVAAATIQNGFAKAAKKGNVLLELIDMQPTVIDWIPVEERLPKTEDGYAHVMVSMDDDFVCTTDYTENDGFELWADSGEVIAWLPLPESYRPGPRKE